MLTAHRWQAKANTRPIHANVRTQSALDHFIRRVLFVKCSGVPFGGCVHASSLTMQTNRCATSSLSSCRGHIYMQPLCLLPDAPSLCGCEYVSVGSEHAP